MKPWKLCKLLSVLVLASTVPATAQVQKVAMRTTGISCGVCAGLSEIHFRQVPGVEKVNISLSKEAIMLTYKPGAVFDPAGIRKILSTWQVGVVEFQISARGRVEGEAGKQMFLAGKDKFVLAAPLNAPEAYASIPILIEAVLNDHATPMELKILNYKPLPE